MKKRKRVSKELDIARRMPPLYHKLPGENFDINKSEVAKWLVNQPDIVNYVVNRIKAAGTSNPLICYNPSTGKWQGVDYEEIIHDGSFSNCAVCDNHTCEDGYCSWDE